MPLPERFCWTRFGIESGETIEEILIRKERERALNKGLFLWGIGNAIGPGLRELLKFDKAPALIFSPIRSKARIADIVPSGVVHWKSALTMSGDRYELPEASTVTSRSKSGTKRARHYALVCSSDEELKLDPLGEVFAVTSLRNIASNKPIGASQVTAVVRRFESARPLRGTSYQAMMRVRLAFPYFIELADPAAFKSPLGLRAAAA